MIRHILIKGLLLLAAGSFHATSQAQILDDDVLGLDSADSAGAWFVIQRRDAISGAITADTDLRALLDEAKSSVGIGNVSCIAPGNDAEERACTFHANLVDYEDLLNLQLCRVDTVLSNVDDPRIENLEAEASRVLADVGTSTDTVSQDGPLASRDFFTPARMVTGNRDILMFGATAIQSRCDDDDPDETLQEFSFAEIVVPSASGVDTDKLIVAYALALSYRSWEFNRPNVEATANRIAKANERWSNFETNVIQDQYPWETLLFNEWAGRASSRFRGTLTHPPTSQLRVLHPVPTAILDVDGDDTLFRPRLTVEVIGLRRLEEEKYTPKRAVSVIAVLPAESGEETGWGLLYTWKRGSLGITYQENALNDEVIGVVFGIDLADQVDSKRNELMEKWEELRGTLDEAKENLP